MGTLDARGLTVVQKTVRREIVMLIRVKYVDERFDMVRPETLDRLLEAGKVRGFQRSDGWITPLIGNLRSKNRNEYFGSDRRMRREGDRRVSK